MLSDDKVNDLVQLALNGPRFDTPADDPFIGGRRRGCSLLQIVAQIISKESKLMLVFALHLIFYDDVIWQVTVL